MEPQLGYQPRIRYLRKAHRGASEEQAPGRAGQSIDGRWPFQGSGALLTTLQCICLVGGFGDSPYLKRALREAFQDVPNGIPIIIASATDPG